MILLNRIAVYRSGSRIGAAMAFALLSVCMGLFVSSAQAQTNASASSATASSSAPDKVTYDFYTWYLKEMVADHDPISSKDSLLHTYVSAALLAEIDKKMKSPDGMEEDYFMRSQDYLDSWTKHIETSHTTVNGTTATVLVTLGSAANKDEIWKLKVTLVKDGQIWKIRRVAQG